MGSVGAKGTLGNTSDEQSVQYHEFTGTRGSNQSETSAFFDDEKNATQESWEKYMIEHSTATKAMHDFTGSSYDGYFAELYTKPWEQISFQKRKNIAALSSAIHEYEVKTPMVTKRYANFQIFGKADGEHMSVAELHGMEGKFLHNNSFLSSSAALHGAHVHSGMCELRIHVPTGKGWGAFVGKEHLSSLGSSESEFLLNNNLWFKVGKTTVGSNGKPVVDLYISGRSSGQKFGSDAITSGPGKSKTTKKK